MAEVTYRVIEAGKSEGESNAPQISLLEVSGARNIVTSLDAFESDCFDKNVAKMRQQYTHPVTGEVFRFSAPTTAGSILAASYDFVNRAKPKILDPSQLQLGRIVRTSEGVFVNTAETDKEKLKALLDKATKVNEIYVCEGDVAFVSYDTFKWGTQEAERFIEGGLARVLEETTGNIAENFIKIASKENYPLGVNVTGFGPVEDPALRVVGMYSDDDSFSGQLVVYGDYFSDYNPGHAFGVILDTAKDGPETSDR